MTVSGSIEDRDVLIAYRQGGKITAIASIGRDMAILRSQVAMEHGDDEALERLAAGA
jgi:hypothetical protein